MLHCKISGPRGTMTRARVILLLVAITPLIVSPITWHLAAEPGTSCSTLCNNLSLFCDTPSLLEHPPTDLLTSCTSYHPWPSSHNPSICSTPPCCTNNINNCTNNCALYTPPSHPPTCNAESPQHTRICPCTPISTDTCTPRNLLDPSSTITGFPNDAWPASDPPAAALDGKIWTKYVRSVLLFVHTCVWSLCSHMMSLSVYTCVWFIPVWSLYSHMCDLCVAHT